MRRNNILLCCYEDKPAPFEQPDSADEMMALAPIQFPLSTTNPFLTGLLIEGTVSVSSCDTTVSKLPKTEQEYPERRNSRVVCRRAQLRQTMFYHEVSTR